MVTTPLFSIRNPFPRLAELTAKASDWLSRKSTHEINFAKWRGALDSAPKDDAQVSLSSVEQTARLFSAAFLVYDDPKNPKKRETLTLNDFHNASSLAESWKSTIEVVRAQGVHSPAATRTNEDSEHFMRNVAHSVAINTGRTAVDLFNADSVGYALRSAHLLSEACAAAKAAESYMLPDIQQRRIETFRDLHGVLESNLAMGTYSSTPVLEARLREAVVQNNQTFETLQKTNAQALEQTTEFSEGPKL